MDIEHFIHKGSLWVKNYKPDLSRCRFSVTEHGRVTDWHQCYRKPVKEVEGYGFCNQHAKEVESRLGIRTDETKTRYAASFSNGKPCLIELEVLGETENTIEVCGYKELMGSSYGIYQGRLRKNSQYTNKYSFFDSESDAVQWLYEQSGKYVTSCHETYLDAVEVRMKLEKMVDTALPFMMK